MRWIVVFSVVWWVRLLIVGDVFGGRLSDIGTLVVSSLVRSASRSLLLACSMLVLWLICVVRWVRSASMVWSLLVGYGWLVTMGAMVVLFDRF